MNNNRDEAIHLWEVNASTPRVPGGSAPDYANLRYAVIAKTMERVLELGRKEYPDIRFHQVIRRNYIGKDAVVVDPEAVQLLIDPEAVR